MALQTYDVVVSLHVSNHATKEVIYGEDIQFNNKSFANMINYAFQFYTITAALTAIKTPVLPSR